jgi:hypothetical protein
MSFLFGFIFLLVGLALAVLLGIVLYRDPMKKHGPSINLAKEKDPEPA